MPDKTLGEVLHEAREAGNDGRDRPMFLAPWADRDPRLKMLDEAMAAAVAAAVLERLRTHEHEWTRCAGCKQPGRPCPCSGEPCCEMERREIAAGNEAARDERERIRRLAIEHDAFYDAPCPDGVAGCIHQDTPFANLITEPSDVR